MKLLIVVCAFVALASAFPRTNKLPRDRDLNDLILEALEDLREKMSTGLGPSGIILAPLNIKEYNFDLNIYDIFKFSGPFQDVTVTGLDGFQVDRAYFSVARFQLEYNFNFPDIVANGFYNVTGKLFNLIPIFGAGNFVFAPEDLRIQGNINLTTDATEHLLVKDFYMRISLKKVNCNFEGLLGGGDLSDVMNLAIQDGMVTFFNLFHKQVSKTLESTLGVMLNEFINNYTLMDLIDMLPPS